MDIIAELQLEEANLVAELHSLAVFRRLEAVRTSIKVLAEAYNTPVTAHHATEPPVSPTVGVSQQPPTSAPKLRKGSQSTRVAEMAEALFRSTNKRFQSGDLLKHLERQGIGPIEGKKPSAVVASILSHHPLFDNGFDSHGIGYGLKEWTLPHGHAEKPSEYDLLEKVALEQMAKHEAPADSPAGA